MQFKEYHNHVQIWVPAKSTKADKLYNKYHLSFMMFLLHVLVFHLRQKFGHVESLHQNPAPNVFPLSFSEDSATVSKQQSF